MIFFYLELLLNFDSIRDAHKKNNFAEISKNLDINLKIILLSRQNNYANIAENFNILAISLRVLHNYFDGSKKICLAKFLDISAKSFKR